MPFGRNPICTYVGLADLPSPVQMVLQLANLVQANEDARALGTEL